MGDSELAQELESTRAALQTALSIGYTLQARVEAAAAELKLDERQLTDAELVAVLEGKS